MEDMTQIGLLAQGTTRDKYLATDMQQGSYLEDGSRASRMFQISTQVGGCEKILMCITRKPTHVKLSVLPVRGAARSPGHPPKSSFQIVHVQTFLPYLLGTFLVHKNCHLGWGIRTLYTGPAESSTECITDRLNDAVVRCLASSLHCEALKTLEMEHIIAPAGPPRNQLPCKHLHPMHTSLCHDKSTQHHVMHSDCISHWVSLLQAWLRAFADHMQPDLR